MKQGSKKAIVVLGSQGRLAQSFQQLLGKRALYFSKEQWDITNPAQSARRMRTIKPAILINCAAYVLVDKAELKPEKAFAVNALGPLTLRKLCEQHQSYLVHFSTDYVFAGDRKRPYHEQDKPAPINFYGLSKWIGEVLVQSYPNHLTIRTSALFGQAIQSQKKDFIVQIIAKAAREKKIQVVQNIVSPSYTIDVARLAQKLIQKQVKGTIHLANRGKTSWLELSRYLVQKAHLSTKVVPLKGNLPQAIAPRPFATPLTSRRLPEMKLSLPSWQNAVQRYLAELQLIQA